jgi:hypothetical protein
MPAPGVYSVAPEGTEKRIIDAAIERFVDIDMHDAAYLRQLIGLSSLYKKTVSERASGLQFFIVKGGGEGFLDSLYAGKDASRIVRGGERTTSGAPGTMMIFDDNDLIAAFDQKGNLVSSALLRRPISIRTPDDPNKWTEGTANKVYDAWDGQPVSIYRNTNPDWDIHYYGLWINDKLGYYTRKKGWVRIDLHKKEATNGCIFIMDPNTPPMSEPARLNAFEPRFIKDVQKAIDAKTKSNIGTMHMIKMDASQASTLATMTIPTIPAREY